MITRNLGLDISGSILSVYCKDSPADCSWQFADEQYLTAAVVVIAALEEQVAQTVVIWHRKVTFNLR